MRRTAFLAAAAAAAFAIPAAAASADSSKVEVHLFQTDVKFSAPTETTFQTSANASFGTRVRHGAPQGTVSLSCTQVSRDRAICNGNITIYAPGAYVAWLRAGKPASGPGPVFESLTATNVAVHSTQDSLGAVPVNSGTGPWAGFSHGFVRSINDSNQLVAVLFK